MSSTQFTHNISFMYAGKSYNIKCQGKDKFRDVVKKFLLEFNPDSEERDYIFKNEGNKIELDQSIEKLIKNEPFIIEVEKNIKIIQCPKCNYGDCVVSLYGYKTIFYNCEHKHLVVSSYDNYKTDQNFFPEKIKCCGNDCRQNAKTDPNFLMCLTCSKTCNKTKSICNKCYEKHIKELNEKHFKIKYEDKNYWCRHHIKEMKKYCFKCKKNICEDCEKEHDHSKEKEFNGKPIISIDLLIPKENELKELKNSMEKIEKYINKLKVIKDNLIYNLNAATRMYENYYKIANNIIMKYETFNKKNNDLKNFTIFKCLRNLKFSNKKILDDLKSIIEQKKDEKKFEELNRIYKEKKDDYYRDKRIGDNLNIEDDIDWFNEVLKRKGEVPIKNPIDPLHKEPIEK